jgi:hypothetical protein
MTAATLFLTLQRKKKGGKEKKERKICGLELLKNSILASICFGPNLLSLKRAHVRRTIFLAPLKTKKEDH